MSVFSIKPDSVRPYGNVLIGSGEKLRQYSGEITTIMGELDGSLEEVKPSLEVLANQTMEESNALSKLGDALTQIVTAYTSAESNITGNMNGSGKGGSGNGPIDDDEAKDGSSELYDGDGQYGGDQMNFEKHDDVHHFLCFNWGKDLALYEFIRQHPGYENMTDDEIKAMLESFTDGGCGWVAETNMIFAEFEGRPEDFEKTFGFPMYDENGDLNYDKLAIDLYLSTQGKFYIGDDDIKGDAALNSSICSYYKKHPDEFKQRYGIDLKGADGKVTDDAWDKICEEGDALKEDAKSKGLDYVEYDKDPTGTNYAERENRVKHYLAERGVDSYTTRDATGASASDIQTAIDNGETPIISAAEFNLYDEQGNKINQDPIGDHAMVITGVTADGKYIVSSWGERYILDPNEVRADGSSVVKNIKIDDIY
ncbi:hypothetical protein [Butyrivibrio sp. AE3009]|uniref:hypothetical protein n=1 Tax=Butyrivibrio sp. AE3009 TaxID=1280666 RepID=UPI0003B487A2|nr:hypothetical protein [Butyrivibrio sp. AE3009]